MVISIDVFVDYRGGGVVYISALMRNVGWQRHSVGKYNITQQLTYLCTRMNSFYGLGTSKKD